MKDLLINLKEQLESMIETIENYIGEPSGDVIIRKEDLRYLKWIGQLNNNYHVFEYRNILKFALKEDDSNLYPMNTFKNLMNGTLDRIILNVKSTPYLSSGHLLTHDIENHNKTKLRDLYNQIPTFKEDKDALDNETK